MTVINRVSVHSPAKLNLFLAVTNRREDGYHDLETLMVQTAFGDDVDIALCEESDDRLTSNVDSIPLDGSNLALKALGVFRERHKFEGGVQIHIEKRIPTEAGLGGGSSNGSAVLLGLNRLLGEPLSIGELEQMAIGLGSDCAAFVHSGATIQRGRWEPLESIKLEASPFAWVVGKPVVIFKPPFAIGTSWAFSQFSADDYIGSEEVSKMHSSGCVFNHFEEVVVDQYPDLGDVLGQIRGLELKCAMTGSGSACFVFFDTPGELEAVRDIVGAIWGSGTFMVETVLR